MVSRNDEVSTLTMTYICCEKWVTSEAHNFLQEKTKMMNSLMHGLVLRHVGLECLKKL